jgi:hypothetical protein
LSVGLLRLIDPKEEILAIDRDHGRPVDMRRIAKYQLALKLEIGREKVMMGAVGARWRVRARLLCPGDRVVSGANVETPVNKRDQWVTVVFM